MPSINHNNNNNADQNEAFDLSFKLRQRLRETNGQKERIQSNLAVQADQLQRLLAKLPKKPRDSMEQMEKRLEDLEYQRTKTSLALSDEKAILRQIAAIKKSKIQLAEYQERERGIQEKKSELSTVRDSLRTVTAAAAELEAALSKVELAKRLGCTTAELETRILDCPEGKLGHVIGKNGSNLKQLEERTGVHIDVDKVGSKIHLHGSEVALDAAVAEVENITLSVEENVKLPLSTVSYLLAKRSAVLQSIQQDHAGVYFDVTRDSTTLQLRGRPENVALAKDAILAVQVKKQTKRLAPRETGLVVGKGGVTVSKLTDTHNVVINVSKESDEIATVEVIGLEANVDAAFAEINAILYENEEIEDYVIVQPMQRNKFLSNSGAIIKELQSSIAEQCGGNVLLLFEKVSKEDVKEPSKLVVKATRFNITAAKEAVQGKVDYLEGEVIKVTVRPDVVPSIIGKGGATINALRKEGSGADIEVEKYTGVIRIQADDDETRNAIIVAIDKIVSENQLKNVELEKAMFGTVFGEAGKELRKKIADEMNVVLSIDPSDRHVILRGTQEKIDEAAAELEEFLANNYSEEFEISPDDEGLMYKGGPDSIIKQVETDHNVKLSLRKSSHVLILRGTKENVAEAMKVVHRFFRGSEGFAVHGVKIPEILTGVMIGKGGSGIAKLEADFKGITVHMHRDSNILSMRGPEEMVKSCQASVIKLVATSKVNDTVRINKDQREILDKPETLKKITDGMAVQINLSDASARLRGTSLDVKDARALLLEQLNGTYETVIDLDPRQLLKVRESVNNDPSHLERIQKSTSVTTSVDLSVNGIKISGKRSNVKKAKTFVMAFLDGVLPSEFAKVKVLRPLFKAMCDHEALANIAVETGAYVTPDRDMSCVLVQSSDPSSVDAAVRLLNERLVECGKLIFVERFEPADSWIIPRIIGKKASTVQKLQEDSGCTVNVVREENTVVISGGDENAVSNAKEMFFSIVDKARKECIFLDVPESAMPSFVGKQGGNIRKLAAYYHVTIDRLKKDPTRIQVQGDEVSVQAAKSGISTWLRDWETKNGGIEVVVRETLLGDVLANLKAMSKGVQREYGCKLDIVPRECRVIVTGGQKAKRETAAAEIRSFLEKEEQKIRMIAASQAQEAKLAVEANKAEENGLQLKKEPAIEPVALKPVVSVPPPQCQEPRQKAETVINGGKAIDHSNNGISAGIRAERVPDNAKKEPQSNGSAKIPESVKRQPEALISERANRGTEAAQSLLSMLVSKEPAANDAMPVRGTSKPNPLSILLDDQWNSSSQKSAPAVASGSNHAGGEHENGDASTSKPYFKSMSGFNVRV